MIPWIRREGPPMDPKFDRSIGLIGEVSSFFAAIFAALAVLSCLAAPARAQSDDGAAAAISSALSDSDASVDSDATATDDASSDDSPDAAAGQVLELPQTIDPSGAQGTAADGGDGQPQDQLGSIDDYQDQSAASGLAVLPGSAPVRLGTVPLPRMAGVPVFEGGAGMVPVLPFIARPGGLGPFPSSSPMLFSPRGSAAMPGGWWTRTRR